MVKSAIQNLAEYQPEESLESLAQKLDLKKVVRLSANENPLGSSPRVKEALVNNLTSFNRYPDSETNTLRKTIVNKLSIQPDQLMFGNGSDELISLICQTFLNPGDNVVQPKPTFGEYGINSLANGASIRSVNNKDDGQIDLEKILTSINYNTQLVWLCNPNNPTGKYLDKNSIKKFLNQVSKSTIVVIDEAYVDFVAQDNPSFVDQINNFSNVIILRTFSKMYGLANLRIGYAIADSKIISLIQKIRAPYNLSSIDDIAGTAALQDTNFTKEIFQNNQVEMKKWKDFLSNIDCYYYDSQTNFILFKIDRADELADYLKGNGYLLRNGLIKGWLRVSMGTAQENESVRKFINQFYNL